MNVEIGSLDKRISFIGKEKSENEIGQTVLLPCVVKTVWARVEPLRGREYYEAQKIRAETTYKITTRFHADITEDMTIRFRGQEFEIKSIINPYMANKKLECICVERLDGRESGERI